MKISSYHAQKLIIVLCMLLISASYAADETDPSVLSSIINTITKVAHFLCTDNTYSEHLTKALINACFVVRAKKNNKAKALEKLKDVFDGFNYNIIWPIFFSIGYYIFDEYNFFPTNDMWNDIALVIPNHEHIFYVFNKNSYKRDVSTPFAELCMISGVFCRDCPKFELKYFTDDDDDDDDDESCMLLDDNCQISNQESKRKYEDDDYRREMKPRI